MVVSNICYFHPYLGRWSNLTNIFHMGWNHQLEDSVFNSEFCLSQLSWTRDESPSKWQNVWVDFRVVLPWLMQCDAFFSLGFSWLRWCFLSLSMLEHRSHSSHHISMVDAAMFNRFWTCMVSESNCSCRWTMGKTPSKTLKAYVMRFPIITQPSRKPCSIGPYSPSYFKSTPPKACLKQKLN